jgi:8-oxo-dGTP pyrophosphatase MutT (NUDIX family)
MFPVRMSTSPKSSGPLSNAQAAALHTIDPAAYNSGLEAVRGLTADGLRARFKVEREWQREMLGDQQFADMREAAGGDYRRAAVLVPVVAGDELSVLLTRRTPHLKNHAGQVSFPGGRAEDSDADAIDTALREATEEVGLARERVEVVGILPNYYTVTRYEVTPVVALVHPPFELKPDPGEVDLAFQVPLSFILDPANHQKRSREWEGRERFFYAMPYEGHFIWGATAAMLRNFYHFMRA